MSTKEFTRFIRPRRRDKGGGIKCIGVADHMREGARGKVDRDHENETYLHVCFYVGIGILLLRTT